MVPYPCWEELPLADRLRLAAVEAEIAQLRWPFIEAICRGADLLEEPSLEPGAIRTRSPNEEIELLLCLLSPERFAPGTISLLFIDLQT